MDQVSQVRQTEWIAATVLPAESLLVGAIV